MGRGIAFIAESSGRIVALDSLLRDPSFYLLELMGQPRPSVPVYAFSRPAALSEALESVTLPGARTLPADASAELRAAYLATSDDGHGAPGWLTIDALPTHGDCEVLHRAMHEARATRLVYWFY